MTADSNSYVQQWTDYYDACSKARISVLCSGLRDLADVVESNNSMPTNEQLFEFGIKWYARLLQSVENVPKPDAPTISVYAQPAPEPATPTTDEPPQKEKP